MNDDYMKKYIEFYKSNPETFAEKFFGLKLYWYQKIMLRILNSKNRGSLK